MNQEDQIKIAAVEKSIDQKMEELRKRRKAKIAEIEQETPKAIDQSGSDLNKADGKDTIIPDGIIEGKGSDKEEIIEGEFSSAEKSDAEKIEKDLLEDLSGKKENGNNLKELKDEVERSRKEYLDFDYKKKGALKRIRDYFSGARRNKEEEGKNFERDAEVAQYRAYYDNALLNYKNALLENAKSGNVSDKELSEIAKFFDTEANVTLKDVNAQVKIENQEGRFSEFIKSHSLEIVERYKKLSLPKKMAIGAAFGIAAVSAGYAGGAAVGIVASAAAVRRAFMGVVTGTSTALAFEKLAEKRTGNKIKERLDSLETEISKLSDEDKLAVINKFIETDIKDKDNEINKIKNKNLRHLAYGVSAGVFASFILPKLTSVASEFVKEHFGGGPNLPHSGGTTKGLPAGETISSHGSIRAGISEAPTAEGATPKVFENVIEIKKGDSVWKIVEEQVKERYGNQFDEMNPAQKTHLIDALKDKISADPQAFGLENADNLKTGQKLDLTSLFNNEQDIGKAFDKAHNLSQEALENIDKHNESLKDWVKNHPGEGLTSDKTEEILSGKEKISGMEPNTPEDISELDKRIEEIRASQSAQTAHETIGDTNPTTEIEQTGHEPIGDTNQGADVEQVETKNSEFFNQIANENSIKGVANNVRKNIALGDSSNWKAMKDLTYSQVKNGRFGSDIKGRIINFYQKSLDAMGDEIKPKRAETVEKWTERVSRLAFEKKASNF